jgi:hypothetical protein
MTPLTISTPALLFPAVSLLFLAYTNRFLHLAALVRQLHRDWTERQDDCLRAQIDNMRKRLALIRWMQLLGAVSILLCVVAMVAVMLEADLAGWIAFLAALLFMGGSLVCLILEIACSGGALKILLDRVERN